MNNLRILGIDPGTATTGYGIVDRVAGVPTLVDYGTILTSPKLAAADRLVEIYQEMLRIIDQYEPNVFVIERLFFSKNVTTGMAVSQACGVMQLAAAQKCLEIVEYTPMEVKMAVVGYGGAEKKQVQFMIKQLLRLTEIPKPDDAADALALCVCHAHSEKIKKILSKSL